MTNGLTLETPPKTKNETIKIDEDFQAILEETEEIEEKPKKRGRKKKKEPELLQVGETFLLPLNYVLKNLSKRYNEPAFELNDFEKNEFSKAIDKVASKYVPLWLDKYNDELALCFISFTIFYPRYQLYQKIKTAEKEKPSEMVNPIRKSSIPNEVNEGTNE